MTTTMTVGPPTTNMDAMTDKYVRLRDKIKEVEERHKAELAPFKDALETLGNALLQCLNSVQADHIATSHGTVTKVTKDSAKIVDMAAFWTFVVSQGMIEDMCDRKANTPAVREYMKEHGTPVPGVNFSSYQTIGVRRK